MPDHRCNTCLRICVPWRGQEDTSGPCQGGRCDGTLFPIADPNHFQPGIWRHNETDSFYRVLFLAKKSTNRLASPKNDPNPMRDVVYLSLSTGEPHTRDFDEFMLKGRFTFIGQSLPAAGKAKS